MSGRYNAGRQAFAEGNICWPRDRIMAQLVSSEYEFSEWHKSAQAIKGAVGKPAEVKRCTVEGGIYSCGDIRFPEVGGKKPAVAMIVYAQGGPLLAFLDDIEGLPMKPNGGELIVPGGRLWQPPAAAPGARAGRYNAGREAFGTGELSWTRNRIVAQLVGPGYQFNAAHRDATDLTDKIGEPAVLPHATVSGTGGVRSSAPVAAKVMHRPAAVVLHRGGASISTLIFYGRVDADRTWQPGEALAIAPTEEGWFQQ